MLSAVFRDELNYGLTPEPCHRDMVSVFQGDQLIELRISQADGETWF